MSRKTQNHLISNIATITFFLLISSIGYAEPWLTGPLLALTADPIPPGQTRINFNTLANTINTIYDPNWQAQPISTAEKTIINPLFFHGLTDDVYVLFNFFYQINQNEGKLDSNVGDTDAGLGFQLLTQDKRSPMDLQLIVHQILPTGRYEHLNPLLNGTDATGMGSFQTGTSLNVQSLLHVSHEHYLKTYADIAYIHVNSVSLNGLSIYGGTTETQGRIKPGSVFSIDLAAELTLTQHWVAVMEGFFSYQDRSVFNGHLNKHAGTPLAHTARTFNHTFPTHSFTGSHAIGNGNADEFTMAPAIEYNFSKNLGVIAGVWFTVAGKNTPGFMTPMLTYTGTW